MEFGKATPKGRQACPLALWASSEVPASQDFVKLK